MMYFFSLLKYLLESRLFRPYRHAIGKKLLQYKKIRLAFDKSVKDKTEHFDDANIQLYSKYTTYYRMLESGLHYRACLALIKEYSETTLKEITDKHFSGTIYQDTLTVDSYPDLNLPETLESLYLEIYRRFHMYNGLHDHQFHVANLINLQLISCVADLFGTDLNTTSGLVTTGGTQSIMVSARAYMNHALEVKHFKREQCVILAPDTFHASLLKAQEAYGFNLVLVPTDHGMIDYNTFVSYVEYYHHNLVALYCSYPSYSYGNKDSIYWFKHMANTYHVGLHVDLCLGGFVVNFIDDNLKFWLATEGITSISIDTHKNGLAPKGSSVLLTKQFGDHNLIYYSIYAFADWSGGLYGTPKDEGSVSCVESFCALITLLYYGKQAYTETARDIYIFTHRFVDHLDKHPSIELINADTINVVAFRLKPNKFKTGATYYLSDLLEKKGYVFNCLTNDIIHFCMTKRFVSKENSMTNLLYALDDSIAHISLNPNLEFDGKARLYCSIDLAIEPKSTSTKYSENYFFGKLGVIAVIKKHFMSIINPYLR